MTFPSCPTPVQAGTRIGTVSGSVAEELGLPKSTAIVAGTHDQCANALGCGVTEPGFGMSGMGTYLTIMPVFTGRKPPEVMMRWGLNTEHHAAPGRFVSFIYNQGGLLVKWYRDTFARADREAAERAGRDVYAELIREIPSALSSVFVLPHFTVTGPPEFVTDSSGVIVGLKLDTTRGDILKGIMEGVVFYHKALVDSIADTGIALRELRAVGGGSKSDAWLQVSADILGMPLVRTQGLRGRLPWRGHPCRHWNRGLPLGGRRGEGNGFPRGALRAPTRTRSARTRRDSGSTRSCGPC